MSGRMTPQDLAAVAPAGHYIALRVGFAFPMEEINLLPPAWVDHYTKGGYMLLDPVVQWAYTHTGTTTWSALRDNDPHGILAIAATFGLRFGLCLSIADETAAGQRSFATFARADREFEPLEVRLLAAYLDRRHAELSPPTNLTRAELEALNMVKDGMRLKEIAYDLGVSEGAVKQRLKGAKTKLHANTSTQAATLARQYRLI